MASAVPARLSPKRDHLVATAWRLFYRDGYRAVGIDTILAEADVAKMTLYNHFKSKDDLIVAVLEKRSAEILQSLRQATGTDTSALGTGTLPLAEPAPARRLLAVFDWLFDFATADEFKGCAFIRALSEFPEVDHPVHQAAWDHKAAMTRILAELSQGAGAKDPAGLAEVLRVLIDGALVSAHASGSPGAAYGAKAAATDLIKLASA